MHEAAAPLDANGYLALDEAIDAEEDEYAKNRGGYLDKIFGEGKLGEAAKKVPGRPAGRPEGQRPRKEGEQGPGPGRMNPVIEGSGRYF